MKYLLTDIGAELLAKLGVTGEGLHLTRAQAGEGYSDTPEEMTALINGQLDMQIADLERQGAITTLTLLVINHTLQEEHRIQQIGIFAQDGEESEEVLFIVGQDQNGDVLPSIDYGRVEYRYTVNLKISNAQNIILDVNDTDFVLKKTFSEQVGKVDVLNKGNLQEQIDKVTVAVDEKIMKYLGAAEEGEGLGFADGLDADNVVDAVNKVFISGNEAKNKLVENLIAMGISASTDETLGQLIDKVLNMTDTSGDTVTETALLAGYTAHNAAGVKITGTIANKGNTTQDATPTQDNTYTYLSVPANGYYNTASKLRTSNSNIIKYNRTLCLLAYAYKVNEDPTEGIHTILFQDENIVNGNIIQKSGYYTFIFYQAKNSEEDVNLSTFYMALKIDGVERHKQFGYDPAVLNGIYCTAGQRWSIEIKNGKWCYTPRFYAIAYS